MKKNILTIVVIAYLIGIVLSFGWFVFDFVGFVFGYGFGFISLWSFLGFVLFSAASLYGKLLLETKKMLINRARLEKNRNKKPIKPISNGFAKSLIHESEKRNHVSEYHK